jgi:hypothetical protein
MTALAEIVNQVDQSSKDYSVHSIVTYINFKMIPAKCKTRLPEFKAQLFKGQARGTQIQNKNSKIVDAICAVQYIPRVVQPALYTQSVSPFPNLHRRRIRWPELD